MSDEDPNWGLTQEQAREQWSGNLARRIQVYEYLGVPEDLRDVFTFVEAEFVPVSGAGLMLSALSGQRHETNLSLWHLHLPTKLGRPVIMPLPEKVEDEGHWRAIITAAADLQGMVNRGEYKL